MLLLRTQCCPPAQGSKPDKRRREGGPGPQVPLRLCSPGFWLREDLCASVKQIECLGLVRADSSLWPYACLPSQPPFRGQGGAGSGFLVTWTHDGPRVSTIPRGAQQTLVPRFCHTGDSVEKPLSSQATGQVCPLRRRGSHSSTGQSHVLHTVVGGQGSEASLLVLAPARHPSLPALFSPLCHPNSHLHVFSITPPFLHKPVQD